MMLNWYLGRHNGTSAKDHFFGDSGGVAASFDEPSFELDTMDSFVLVKQYSGHLGFQQYIQVGAPQSGPVTRQSYT